MRKPRKRLILGRNMRVLQGILLSLFIHFFLVWVAQYAPVLETRLATKPITIDIIESQNKTKNKDSEKNRQIVREALLPDKLKAPDSDDPLRFLSAQTQRVKQQTKALLSGMTKNRSQTSPTKPADERQKKSTNKATIDPPKGLDAFAPHYRKVPPFSEDLNMEKGLSSLGESLPQEVAIGSFTALNTDRYLYYSFFARVEELIRFRWESSIREAIDTTPAERFQTNLSGLWNTQMDIWLKPNGEFHSAHLMKESGFRAFDQAAVQAFVQSRLFPNPPQEMIESDGLIHLKYSFQVRYEPKVLVRSRE